MTGWFSADCCCDDRSAAADDVVKDSWIRELLASIRSMSRILIEASTDPVAITVPWRSNAAARHGALCEVT